MTADVMWIPVFEDRSMNKDDVRVTRLQQELLDALLAGVEVKLIRFEKHKHLFTRTDIHMYVTREANALLRKGLIECIEGKLKLVRANPTKSPVNFSNAHKSKQSQL